MKLYRVAVFTENGTSAGFAWFQTLRAAQARKREAIDNDPQELREPEIQCIEIQLTRAGLLRALERYASHPDNG